MQHLALENWDPYQVLLTDVKNGSSDTTMCSTWIGIENYRDYDLTSFIDRHCLTFLVPVQQLIKDGSTVYILLSGAVWALYIGTFVITGILLISIARVYSKKLKKGNDVRTFELLSECYMNLVNIASAHGIQRFARPIALKIIVMRYILCCYNLRNHIIFRMNFIPFYFSWMLVSLALSVS